MSAVLTGLAALSIVVGSIVAISQTDMKRLLAYSSIAHAGYALLGFVSGTPEGATATMTYAFLYVFMTLGAFCVVIALGLSQPAFASRFGFTVDTVRNWEQGRRKPDVAARAYLTVIARRPDDVRKALTAA